MADQVQYQNPYQYQPPPLEKPKSGKGCFFWGCISLVVVMIIGFFTAVFGVRFFYIKVVDAFTDDAPKNIPKVEKNDAMYDMAKAKIQLVNEDIDAGKPARLELTEDDLNILIAMDPNWNRLKDKAYIEIKDGQIGGQISLPLDEMAESTGLNRLKGRYLNAAAEFSKVSLRDGQLILNLESAEVKGNPIPENIMTQLRNENLARDINNDPDTVKTFRKFEKIEVEGGKLVVIAKAGALKSSKENTSSGNAPETEPSADETGTAKPEEEGSTNLPPRVKIRKRIEERVGGRQ